MSDHKNIYNFIFSCFFLLLNFIFYTGSSASNDTVYLYNSSNKTVYLNYHNEFNWGSPSFIRPFSTLKIVADSCCSTPLVLINSDESQVPFIVSKSDSFNVTFKNNSLVLSPSSYSNLKTTETNYLQNLYTLTGPLNTIARQSKGIKEVYQDQYFINLFKRRIRIVDNSFEHREISEEFQILVKQFITSYLIDDLISANTKSTDKYLFLDSIAKEFFKLNLFGLFPYKQALSNYHLLLKKRYNTMSDDSLLRNYFSQNSIDYLVSKELYDYLRLNKNIDSLKLKIFSKNCKNENYKVQLSKLASRFAKFDKFEFEKESLITYRGSTILFDSLLRSKSDKLYLLDFWASWCIPCRNEFKYLPATLTNLKRTNIEYVLISTDEDSKLWRQAIINERLVEFKYNFQIEFSSKSSVLEKFKIITIPRYILVDAFGNVINTDMPRPSTIEFQRFISKYSVKVNL
jgi:thiol-disulfide isomerase/thioredoxin